MSKIARKIRDPRWFVPRMGIVDKNGNYTNLKTVGLLPGQKTALEALCTDKRICILKSRQLGITTLVTLFMLHRALVSAKSQYGVLTMTHEGEAVGRVNKMFKHAISQLGPLRPHLPTDNMNAIELGHNGSLLKQLMAGGRSQGRSFTYQAIHATEMGFWPKGSSAREGMSVDEDVWAAALSTLHESERTRIVIESTAYGPSGVFYSKCRAAQESSKWKFLFFPWFDYPDYSMDPGDDWERRDDEHVMAELYGLTDAQLAWRRFKIEDEGYGLRRFRQEYPSNAEEPWLVATGMWYDTDVLNQLLGGIPAARHDQKEGWTFVKGYEANRRYYIGIDPAGGTGRDQAAIQVLRDDLEQVAWYSSRHAAPYQLAEEGARISVRYGKCPVLVEYNNKYGKACFERLKKLGARLWKTPDGKPWFTDQRTKAQLHDHAKMMIDGNHVIFHDPLTVQEFLHVREQDNGNIEADPGKNDDRVMAFVLALWCARRGFSTGRRHSLKEAIAAQRSRRHKDMGLK